MTELLGGASDGPANTSTLRARGGAGWRDGPCASPGAAIRSRAGAGTGNSLPPGHGGKRPGGSAQAPRPCAPLRPRLLPAVAQTVGAHARSLARFAQLVIWISTVAWRTRPRLRGAPGGVDLPGPLGWVCVAEWLDAREGFRVGDAQAQDPLSAKPRTT